MNHTTNNGAIAQITAAPMVRCVNIDGSPVPEWERDIPFIEPDPTDPLDWPGWTDNFFWEATDMSAFEAWFRADDADEDARAQISGEAPDGADIVRRMIEAGTLQPVSGGAPDDDEPEPFIPSALDWDDYRCWDEECDARDEASRREIECSLQFGYE
jgi:hypothetical protein